jgi:4-hydroxy-3-polyprenylbenzoate decarboxylase
MRYPICDTRCAIDDKHTSHVANRKSHVANHKSPFLFHFDEGVDTSDFRTCAWLLGNHIDAVRDCKVVNDQLVVDARSKVAKRTAQAQEAGWPARWPNVVCAHRNTIQAIDDKWPSLGLGDFLPSPSLKYAALVRPGGAVVEHA